MTQNKAQRPTKAREFTPQPATTDEALLRAILAELQAIRARLETMGQLDEAIARGVRWAIGGRVDGK